MPEWKGKSRGGSFGYKFFIWLLKYLGRSFAYAFLCVVVPYFIIFAPKATIASWQYWHKILHKNIFVSVGKIFLHYYRFGQIIIDKFASISKIDTSFTYDFENYDEFLKILNGEKGVILIGAHFGNWQVGENFFGKYASRINIVMYDAEYQKIKENIKKTLGDKIFNVIPVNKDNLTHVFMIKDALDKKEYVCFQGDRYVDKKNTMERIFLGEKALFPAGPFQIAARLKVPVVFYFSEKESRDNYKFRFYIAQTSIREKGTKPEDILLNQYIKILENRINVHPEQWFNFYKFWS